MRAQRTGDQHAEAERREQQHAQPRRRAYGSAPGRRRPRRRQVATHDELEITALVAQDQQRARDFVATTLGRLAEETATAARLRETLRVFLEEAENAPRTAARLRTHRNTILHRVARATELLGYPPGEKRLAVELALELRRRLGGVSYPSAAAGA